MIESQFVTVSEWMVNGSINEFVKVHMDADRLKLVRIPFNTLTPLIIDGRMIAVAGRHY